MLTDFNGFEIFLFLIKYNCGSWLRWSERRLRSCVVRYVTASSHNLPVKISKLQPLGGSGSKLTTAEKTFQS